ncbi:unnamed protein product [Sphagnum jensenii]|uniref:Uncharacterized protein n=1 Tax=Sphagnum jensenii TaxID=128206 RepID=A0ABP1AGN1_9BRYO
MIDLLQLQHDTDHDHTGNTCTTTTASSSNLISTTDHEHAEREITMLVRQQQQPEQLVHDSAKSLESFGDQAALVLADPDLMKKKSMQQLHKTMRSSPSSSSSSQLPSIKGWRRRGLLRADREKEEDPLRLPQVQEDFRWTVRTASTLRSQALGRGQAILLPEMRQEILHPGNE